MTNDNDGDEAASPGTASVMPTEGMNGQPAPTGAPKPSGALAALAAHQMASAGPKLHVAAGNRPPSMGGQTHPGHAIPHVGGQRTAVGHPFGAVRRRFGA